MQRLFVTFMLTAFTFGAARAQAVHRPATTPVAIRKPVRAVTPTTYAGRQLMVGRGGGVTGASTTYYLLENGQLFGRRNRDSAFTFIGKQTTTTTKRLFTTAESACGIKKTKFDNPGNRYQFVGWRRGQQTYKVTWGDPDTIPPASYPKLYNSFMAIVPVAKRL